MDRLDLEILQTMGFVPWGREPIGFDTLSTGYIADEVSTTTVTVRERIDRMEEDGVVTGYQVYPSFSQLGIDGGGYVFEVDDPDEKAQAFEEVRLLDGVVDVTDLMGPELLVGLGFRTDSELERRLRLIGRHTGDEDPMRISRARRQDVGRPFSHLDWRIVRALRGRADASFSEVADEVGVSYRTVKRRVDRMTDEGHLLVAPVVEAGEISGLIPFDLFCEIRTEAGDSVRNELTKLYPDRLLAVRPPAVMLDEYFDLVLFAETMAELEEMRQQASQLEGVENALAVVTRRSRETDWLDALIDAQVRETAPTPGGE